LLQTPSPVPDQGEETKEEPKEPEVNPELAKYYKMIQFGVPIQAVKLKMQQEGLDPNLLVTKD
jgi:WASH complex subunit CCDC53